MDFGLARIPTPLVFAGASNSSDAGETTVHVATPIHRADKDRSRNPPPLKEPVDVYRLGVLIYEELSRFVYFIMVILRQVLAGP